MFILHSCSLDVTLANFLASADSFMILEMMHRGCPENIGDYWRHKIKNDDDVLNSIRLFDQSTDGSLFVYLNRN